MTGSVKLNTPSAGSVTLSPADTASNVTVTIPASTATLVNASSTQTLTNKTLTAAGSNTVEATSGPTSTQLAGMRNKIINGAMMIDQRNAGASVTPTSDGVYTLDRWQVSLSAASKFSLQQSSTAPTGFINSTLITSLSAYSVPASGYFMFNQPIEGLNFSDLSWGTASAQTVTLSFWVRSSLTGTFGGAIQNNAQNRAYPFSYTISSANTFEYKTVTIAGDTSGSWLTTNGVGAYVRFGLGVGSTFSTTAGSWAAGQYFAPTGAQSVVGTNGATWYVTGVQLEKGATATPFENRLYGTELALCQRYYWQINGENTFAGVASGTMNATTTARFSFQYPVPMRAAPTVSGTSFNLMLVSQGGDLTPTNLTPYANTQGCLFDMNTGSGTLGRGAVLIFGGSGGSIQATAEL